MGLGKTLQLLALVLQHPPPASTTAPPPPPPRHRPRCDDAPAVDDGRGRRGAIEADAPARATLVVCPTSVLSHGGGAGGARTPRPRGSRVRVHHGGGRARCASLASCDLVLTTFGVLAAEARAHLGDGSGAATAPAAAAAAAAAGRKRKAAPPLLGARWRRVVIDEAHSIRNRATRAAAACRARRAAAMVRDRDAAHQ